MTQETAGKALLSRRALLGLAVLGAGGVAAGYVLRGSGGFDGATLSATEAHARAIAGEITLIDIRRPEEWRATGLGEGARPLDMRRRDFTEVLAGIAADDPGRPIALICARGVRSARLSRQLSAAGFTGIIDVPEGMLGSAAGPGWLALGLPTEIYTDPTG